MSAGFSKEKPVENVPPERFQNQGVTSGTQGRSGLVRSALEKLSLFSPTFSVRSKARAQRISLSADSDLEGTCPLRTPRQLRSAGAALWGNDSEIFSFLHDAFCGLFLWFCGASPQKKRSEPKIRSSIQAVSPLSLPEDHQIFHCLIEIGVMFGQSLIDDAEHQQHDHSHASQQHQP